MRSQIVYITQQMPVVSTLQHDTKSDLKDLTGSYSPVHTFISCLSGWKESVV